MNGSGHRRSWKGPGVLVATVLCAAVVAIALYATTGAEVSGETPEDRVASIHRLAADRPHGAAEAIATAVDDRSPEVRRAAMASLTHFANADNRSVIEKGTSDPDGGVRAISADAMGLFHDAAAANTLIKLLQTDPNEQVHLSALRGLARCADPRSAAVLLEAADKGKTLSIKRQAMKSFLVVFQGKLGEMRNPAETARWRDLIQRWKWDQRVRDSYQVAGIRLVDRPQDIIGKDYHPERRTPR